MDDVFIEPRTAQRPAIWVGGGSQLADPKSPDVPKFVKSVKARTLRADGWIPRPTCPPDEIARDWRELQAFFRENGQDPTEVAVAHENFLHLVLTNDPVKAREEQHRAFLKVMSAERGEKYLESVYLFGTPDEIIGSLQARADAGVEQFILHTMTPDPAQLRHWVDEIIPNVVFPATAGPVRRPVRNPASRHLPMTRRVALIGRPLKRRHSVVMHNAAFEAAGIDARYELLEIEADAVAAAVADARRPDFLGLGVTAPYKRVIAGLVRRDRGGRRGDRGREQRRAERERAPRRLQLGCAGVQGGRRTGNGSLARGRRRGRGWGRRRGARGGLRVPHGGCAARDDREPDARVRGGHRGAVRRDRAAGDSRLRNRDPRAWPRRSRRPTSP